MTCDDARKFLGAYFDAELDAARSLEIERHLSSCAACSSAQEQFAVLRDITQAAYFPAPADLRADVLAAIRRQAPVEIEPEAAGPAIRHRHIAQPWLLRGLALAAAILLGFFIGQTFSRNSARQVLLAQLTDSHLRSLVGTHLTDVLSSDQHTVRPWFEGKLDFAPPVQDLAAQGFPLVGGRVEYIGGRNVAALVYQRRKHFVNVFLWPETGEESIRTEPPQRGYNVVHWRRDGMSYFAISEVSEDELRKLAELFTAGVSPKP
jgi:anti-sigma factor RsiW